MLASHQAQLERAAAVCRADGAAFFTYSGGGNRPFAYRLAREGPDNFRLLYEETFTIVHTIDDIIVYFTQIEQHEQMGLDGRTPTAIARVLLHMHRHIKPVTSKMRAHAEKQLKDQLKLFKDVYNTPPGSGHSSRRPSAISLSKTPSHTSLMPTVSQTDVNLLGKKPQFAAEGLVGGDRQTPLHLISSREIKASANFDENDLKQIDSQLEEADFNRNVARVETQSRNQGSDAISMWRKARQKLASVPASNMQQTATSAAHAHFEAKEKEASPDGGTKNSIDRMHL